MKHVRHVLAGSPASAEYAHLARPKQRLGTVNRSHQERRMRGLSDKQKRLGDGLLAKAVERVKLEAAERKCMYLRDFDCFYKHGYRTYQSRWNALADIIEPMLARLNIATMTLGWQDNDGEYHLNRQRGLSEDSTSTKEWTVSRTLSALEQAKYVRRKMRRIFHNGKHWITRVTIHIRPRFFIHLGLAHLLAPLRTDMKAKFNQVLETAGKRRTADIEKERTKAAERKASHQGAVQAREQSERSTKQHAAKMSKEEYSRQWNAAQVDFAISSGLKGRALAEAFAREFPHFAIHPASLASLS